MALVYCGESTNIYLIENCSIIRKYSDIQKLYFSDQKYMDVSKDNDCLSEISSGDSGK